MSQTFGCFVLKHRSFWPYETNLCMPLIQKKSLCITFGSKVLCSTTWIKYLSGNSCAEYSNWLVFFLFDKPLACLEIHTFSRPQCGRLIWQSVTFQRHILSHFLAAVGIKNSIKIYIYPFKRSDSEASNLLKQERIKAKQE